MGSFASPKKGMHTFHYEMSNKWIFTFMNFQNVYWHGKTHSALVCSGTHWEENKTTRLEVFFGTSTALFLHLFVCRLICASCRELNWSWCWHQSFDWIEWNLVIRPHLQFLIFVEFFGSDLIIETSHLPWCCCANISSLGQNWDFNCCWFKPWFDEEFPCFETFVTLMRNM